MTRSQNYYDLFGIAPDATPRQIRDAYLQSIKQHHPDFVHSRTDPGAPELVALINRCYAVLRDPEKRAAYDAQLAQERRWAAAESRRELVPVRSRRAGTRSLWLFLASTSILFAGAVLWIGSSTQFRGSGETFVWRDPDDRAAGTGALHRLRAEDIRRQARLATAVSTARAVVLSNRCFESAREKQSTSAAELCVIFDQALLYRRNGPGEFARSTIYFDDEVAHARHAAALEEFGNGTEAKIRDLREAAFRALLRDVTGADRLPTGSGPKLAEGTAGNSSGLPEDEATSHIGTGHRN
jgi:curved DNA-binding protein CbpA